MTVFTVSSDRLVPSCAKTKSEQGAEIILLPEAPYLWMNISSMPGSKQRIFALAFHGVVLHWPAELSVPSLPGISATAANRYASAAPRELRPFFFEPRR
jgi:hypothetical protein